MEAPCHVQFLMQGIEDIPLVGVPVAVVAQIGSHEGADSAEFPDGPRQFLASEVDVLGREHGGELQLVGAVLTELGDPVVVGLADLDGEVTVDHLAHRQPAGGIEDRAVDAHVVHELQPARRAHLPEGAGHQFVQRGAVEVIQRREEPPLAPETVMVRRRHVREQRFPVLHHVPVAVDDVHPIPGHVRPSLSG